MSFHYLRCQKKILDVESNYFQNNPTLTSITFFSLMSALSTSLILIKTALEHSPTYLKPHSITNTNIILKTCTAGTWTKLNSSEYFDQISGLTMETKMGLSYTCLWVFLKPKYGTPTPADFQNSTGVIMMIASQSATCQRLNWKNLLSFLIHSKFPSALIL